MSRAGAQDLSPSPEVTVPFLTAPGTTSVAPQGYRDTIELVPLLSKGLLNANPLSIIA